MRERTVSEPAGRHRPSGFRVETRAGEPVRAGDTTVTPISRAVVLTLPIANIGVIWNRPALVRIQTGEGQIHDRIIFDQTRQIQFALLGAGLLGSLIIWLALRQRRPTHV